MPKLRVGIVDYLNSKPLAWGFLKGHHANLFAPELHPPARVARLLAEGALDVGLIPSIEVARIPDLEVLPGLCVAAEREVRSVLLVAREPIERVRRIALDANSRTSVALLRVLCADHFGIAPEFTVQPADVERMLADAEAALVIGDPALHVDRDRWRVHDLAGEWRALTGLPFVFAVWAVRAGVDFPDLAVYFKNSLRHGLASLDSLVRESAAEMGLETEVIRRYLTEHLRFFLGEPERAALSEFYRRAHAHGLIDRLPDLGYLEAKPAATATP